MVGKRKREINNEEKKKKRKITQEKGWKKKERKLLKDVVLNVNPKSKNFWFEVAKQVPNRTPNECQKEYQGPIKRKKKKKKEEKKVTLEEMTDDLIKTKGKLKRKRMIREYFQKKEEKHFDDALEEEEEERIETTKIKEKKKNTTSSPIFDLSYINDSDSDSDSDSDNDESKKKFKSPILTEKRKSFFSTPNQTPKISDQTSPGLLNFVKLDFVDTYINKTGGTFRKSNDIFKIQKKERKKYNKKIFENFEDPFQKKRENDEEEYDEEESIDDYGL